MSFNLICGDASAWPGPGAAVDLVFTHPYAPLPLQLQGRPALINLYEARQPRRAQAEDWVGAELTPLGRWGAGQGNTLYVAGLPVRPVELADLLEDGRWFPLALPLRLLRLYRDCIPAGGTVWDGFMGRATVGAACARLGFRYIGMDNDPVRVALARRYLEADRWESRSPASRSATTKGAAPST